MRNYTINNTVTTGLLIAPPEKEQAVWHLHMGSEGSEEIFIPVHRALATYIGRLDEDLRAAAKGLPQKSFTGVSKEVALVALGQTFFGWRVDHLSLYEEGDHSSLCHAGKPHPSGGQALVHLAIPDEHTLLGDPVKTLEGGRVRVTYGPFEQATGVSVLYSAAREGGVEHLVRLMRGASCKVRRALGAPWLEAVFRWNGWELERQVLPAPRRYAPQVTPGATA